MVTINREPLRGSFSISGLSYAQLVELRDVYKLACEKVQEGLADNDGRPGTPEEAKRVAEVQDMYLKLRDAARA